MITPKGEGVVIDTYPLRDIVVVRLDGEERVQLEFDKEELEPWDEVEALRRKAEEPCDKHENGGCSCGKDKMKNKGSKNQGS